MIGAGEREYARTTMNQLLEDVGDIDAPDDASAQLAHDLRNPLGSALMAVTLLRTHIDAAKDVRLLDVLERNLKRLETIIDERIARSSVAPEVPES
jgi:signal transduction histidine kinase